MKVKAKKSGSSRLLVSQHSVRNLGKVTPGITGSTTGLEIMGRSKALGEHPQEESPEGTATARLKAAGTGMQQEDVSAAWRAGMGAGTPMMPERAGDLWSSPRAWSFSQPRDSAKLAAAPPANPSRIDAAKNATAKGQPNNPAL